MQPKTLKQHLEEHQRPSQVFLSTKKVIQSPLSSQRIKKEKNAEEFNMLKINYEDLETIGPLKAITVQSLNIERQNNTSSTSRNDQEGEQVPKITKIQQVWIQITHLDLSRNLIYSLEGIQLLTNLKEVKLSYNKIESIDQLKNIWNKDEIKCLDVRYNPLTNDPNYRHQVIEIFPNLEILDNLSLNFNLLGKDQVFQSFYQELSRDLIPFLTILDQDIAIVEDMLEYISDNPGSLKHLSFANMLESLYK